MIREEALKILGLSDDMAENIKKSYLRLSREHHPDIGGNPETFKQIHEAYIFLSEITQPEPARHEDVYLNVSVSLEEAIFGVVLEVHVRPTMVSSTPMIEDNSKSNANIDLITFVENIQPMMLLQTGSIDITYKNQMLHGSMRNIHITYSIRQHDRYKYRQNNFGPLLLVDEIIPVTTALNGGTIEVMTLYGIRKLFIKPSTNIGDTYELKNHGPLGTLIVRIAGMHMPPPQNIDPATKSMMEKIDMEISKEEEEIAQNKNIVNQIGDNNGKHTI